MVNDAVKKIYTIVFLLFLFIGFIKSGSYMELIKVAQYLSQDEKNTESISVEELETDMVNQVMWGKESWIEINGETLDILGTYSIYSDMGMYVTENKNVVSLSKFTDTDYEFEQTLGLKRFLDENGINFLYVNEPTKYIDDTLFSSEFGIESYSNRNADKLLIRLRDANMNVIDLRDNIKEENLDIQQMFYRTDHHWTTESGLWATKIIAEGLNQYCGYKIDTSIYDEDYYTKIHWNNCWLGEQGRKYGKTFVGLDDYTELKPNFDTNYTFETQAGEVNNTFDYFVDESVYNLDNNVYNNQSWHYSYRQINCTNNNVEKGKILILGDSYEQVTEPFLSLGVHKVDSLILRACDDSFDLQDYIIANGYDTVIVCYAQFMIGAHDDETSANYKMFSFE